jgi:hypothetical protein
MNRNHLSLRSRAGLRIAMHHPSDDLSIKEIKSNFLPLPVHEDFELLENFAAQILDVFIPRTERGRPLCLWTLDGPD